tara:strand:- start:121942 stop:124620 length:2679 start_codon:yes stop_codon:yes gene_type:complete
MSDLKKKVNPEPPRWSLKLLRLFIKKDFLEEIEGDMEEVFSDLLEQHSVKKSRRLYNAQILKLMRPNLIFNYKERKIFTPLTMFKHHCKTSFRSLKKNFGYSAINIFGLAVAIASAAHLLIYIQDEFSYDREIKDGDRIYKMALDRQYPDHNEVIGAVPHSLAKAALNDHPEIEQLTTFAGPFRSMLISYTNSENDIKNYHQNVVAADSNFISFFGLNMLMGNPKTALLEPKSMVLTSTAAKRHFGNDNPIGKIIRMSGSNFNITGVCEDLPANTHLSFEFLMSINTIGRFSALNFMKPDVACYFKLHPEATPEILQAKLQNTVDKNLSIYSESINRMPWKDYKAAGNSFNYFLVPLKKLYLHSDNLGGMKSGGNMRSDQTMIVVAILIILLASINFINLSSAKSIARAKEVGTKKILGSRRGQIVSQFFIETSMISMASLLLALVLLWLTQPYFNELIGRNLSFQLSLQTIGLLFSIRLIITLLAGVYPSIMAANIRPLMVLRGQFISGKRSLWFRDGLVVFQFFISICLVIGMFVMKNQMKFILDKDLGYDKEQLAVISGDFHMDPNFAKSYINEIESIPQIKSVAGSLSMLGLGIFWQEEYQQKISNQLISVQSMKVGDNFPEVMGLRVKEGRMFRPDSWDSLSVILNESAVTALNLSEPIGQQVTEILADGSSLNYTVVGTVHDFNYDDLYNEVSPLVIKSNEILFERASKVLVRINKESDLRQVIANLESKWKELRPSDPFIFQFVDQMIDASYKKEARLLNVFKVFSALSLFIACLGLFALSSFIIKLRTKEIGIRKVNGAGLIHIIVLFGKRTTIMVLIAFAIAAPLASYGIENWWLANFAYRTNIQLWSIFFSGFAILLLAWLTVLGQTIKAAKTNPIDCLRNE